MSSPDSRKAKVTPENKEEARKLREIWMQGKRSPQAEFGEMFGIGNQSAVGQFLRGVTPLSLKAALGFAAGLNCQVADFSPRLAAEISALALTQGRPSTPAHCRSQPSIEDALSIVLDAIAASPNQAEIKTLLGLLVDSNALEYRQRLTSLLKQGSIKESAQRFAA